MKERTKKVYNEKEKKLNLCINVNIMKIILSCGWQVKKMMINKLDREIEKYGIGQPII